MADLKFKLAGAIQEASSGLGPATLAVGRATCGIAVNRRERTPDGQIILGVNPEGPVDHEIVGLRIDSPGGRPLAFAMNYACHPVSQTNTCRRISADFPGPACHVVEELTGTTCLYLQGACGNVRPILRGDDPQVPWRLGTMLGGAAIEAYEAAEPIDATPVRVASRTAALPAITVGSVAQAERLIAALERELAQLKAVKAYRSTIQWTQRRLDYARAALDSLQTGKPLPPVMAPMWAVRIGELGVATAPGEIFVEIGQAVKQRSPFAHTMFLGYTNGHIGYVPVPEAYPEGGYEVDRACRVGPEAAGIITDTALSLLRKVKR
jgi:hypothetical protein